MQNKQKGIIDIIIASLAVIIIGAIGYLILYKTPIEENYDLTPPAQNQGTVNNNVNTTPIKPAPKPIMDSGISGTVLLGPICPVVRIPPDPKCADKPYKTLVVVFPAADPVHAVLFTNSDINGKFSATLPPGEYALGAGESNLPRCNHPKVTVKANEFTSVTISCDTGIR